MVLVAWSNLPTELVEKIADYLPSRTDKFRLRSVCSAWRAALLHHSNHRPRPHSHVTPYNGGFNPVCNTDTDIHLISRTIFLLSPVPNPNPNPNSTYHHFNYTSNSNSNFNSSSWLIKTEEIDDGRTVAISPDSGDIVVVVSEFKLYGENKHLLQMDNELILVDSNNSITSSVLTESEEEEEEEDEDEDEEENLVFAPFAIYKLDRDGSRWAKIDDLGDRVLFLGKNSTFSASASDLNWYDPKGNYICYSNTDDLQSYQVACQNVRAYDMKAAMYCYHDQRYYSKLFWPVPSWVTSTP